MTLHPRDTSKAQNKYKLTYPLWSKKKEDEWHTVDSNLYIAAALRFWAINGQRQMYIYALVFN